MCHLIHMENLSFNHYNAGILKLTPHPHLIPDAVSFSHYIGQRQKIPKRLALSSQKDFEHNHSLLTSPHWIRESDSDLI